MKKLAIAGLLILAAACGPRQASVGTAPGGNVTGAASAREAVQKFMAAAKAQDLQALSNIWGTTAGPVRQTMGREELEQREIILLCYLKHDSYRVLSESPAANNERVLAVESKFRDLIRTANFFATIGPGNRWYVRQFESEKLSDICARR